MATASIPPVDELPRDVEKKLRRDTCGDVVRVPMLERLVTPGLLRPVVGRVMLERGETFVRGVYDERGVTLERGAMVVDRGEVVVERGAMVVDRGEVVVERGAVSVELPVVRRGATYARLLPTELRRVGATVVCEPPELPEPRGWTVTELRPVAREGCRAVTEREL